MSFFRDISPRGAFWGLVEQWNGNPYRWRVLALSIALTSIVFYVFVPPSERAAPRPFDIVYVSTFAEGRTDKDIVASNIENQKIQDERRALEEQREQIRKDAFEAIGRASGLDVDSMKAEIAKEEAEKARELERKRAEVLARSGVAPKAQAETVDGE